MQVLPRNVFDIAQGAPQEYFLAMSSTLLRAQSFVIFVTANMFGDWIKLRE